MDEASGASHPPGGSGEARGLSAVASSAAGRPAAPPAAGASGKRPPGRPPKSTGEYSKNYLRLKVYREKKKESMEELTGTVQGMLQQVELLSAENEVLQLRERILLQSMPASPEEACGPAAQSDGAEGPSPRGSGGGAPTPPDSAGAGRAWGSAMVAPVAVKEGAGLGPGAVKMEEGVEGGGTGAAGPRGAAMSRPERSKEFTELLKRSRLLHDALLQVANRPTSSGGSGGGSSTQQSGSEASGESEGASGGDPVPTSGEMIRLFSALGPEENYTLLVTNLATGELSEPPEALWAQIAQLLVLRPDQEPRIHAALDLLFSDLAAIMTERRAVQRELSSAMHPDGGGGGGGAADSGAGAGSGGGARDPAGGGSGGSSGSGAHGAQAAAADAASEADAAAALRREELLQQLHFNMNRELRCWSTAAWTLRMVLDSRQLGACILHSWPYWPRLALIMAAKFGRTGPRARPPDR